MSTTLPLLYTPPEAQKLLRLSRTGFYEAVARGEVPHIRIGRKILIPRVRLERFLAGDEAVEPIEVDGD